MKKLTRLFAMVMALLMLCTASFASAEDAVYNGTDVMVTVNGTEITRDEITSIASNLMSTFAQYGYDTSDEALMQEVTGMAIDYSIQYALMDQKCAELGYDQLPAEELAAVEAEAKAQWEEVVSMYTQYYGGVTETSTASEIATARMNIVAMLESMGYTEALIIEEAKKVAMYERLEADMIAGAVVTPEDVQAYYEAAVESDKNAYANDVATYEYMTRYYGQTSFYMPEGYRGVTHILLKPDEALLTEYTTLTAALEEQQGAAEDGAEVTGEPVTQEQVDAAYAAIIASVQTTIDEIYAKLEAGAAFADLIVEYGQDPGMQSEPNKSEGYSVHMDSIQWDPAFVKGAFSVENIGDVSQPVVGSHGVHIVYYLRDVPGGAVELTDELAAQLQETLLAEKETQLFNAKMDEWFNAATIVYGAELAGENAE